MQIALLTSSHCLVMMPVGCQRIASAAAIAMNAASDAGAPQDHISPGMLPLFSVAKCIMAVFHCSRWRSVYHGSLTA